MRKEILGALAALLLLTGLAQAQWASYSPAYPPPGYPPPQYGPPYGYPPPGYPPYGPPMPVFQPNPLAPPAPVPAEPTPPAKQVPEETHAAAQASCGSNCNPWSLPPSHPELYDFVNNGDSGSCLRFDLTGEYLYWWTKPVPVSVPLVTTGSITDPTPGAIGQPTTQVLFGGNNVSLPGASGFRLTLGGWLDSDRKFGLEASGFILENQVVNYNNSGSGLGVVGVPINVTGGGVLVPNGPNIVPLNGGAPGQLNPLNANSTSGQALIQTGPYTGGINVSMASQLWGGELNGYYNLFRNKGWSADVLGGVRYLNLQESLNINASNTDSVGFSNVYNDNFQTSNQFYGGQVGLRASVNYCGWSLMGSLKAAFGVNNESSTVNGSTVQTFAGSSTTYAGGILTQPSNIGTQRQTNFSFVPSANLKICYNFNPNVRIFAGYDFLYWTNVVRAANQIDYNVNPNQAYGGALNGPAQPAPMFNQSNYYAQGVSAGMMFSW